MTITPPYPADLEAKGWSLDLDYERIEQSDTWAVASPEQRPWLLMLWLVSWRQVPVASLPDNDRLIAARIGMPLEQFTAWRGVLLAGWDRATDGRLYHRTLTQHALRMAEKRGKDRARVAAFREKSKGVEACNALLTRESPVSSTPTPTPTPVDQELSDASHPHPSADAPGPRVDLSDGFAEFWDAYPRKEAKAAALKVWKSRRLGERPDLAAVILADVRNRAKVHRPWLDGFIPHAPTYLRNERWADAIDTSGPRRQSTGPPETLQARVARKNGLQALFGSESEDERRAIDGPVGGIGGHLRAPVDGGNG